MVGFASDSSLLLPLLPPMRLRTGRATGAAPRDGRNSNRDSDLLPGPQASAADPRDRRSHRRFVARGYGPILRRLRRCSQKRSPSTRHNPGSMRPAGKRTRAIADYNSTIELQRRSESSTRYTESISKYVLRNIFVAGFPILGEGKNKMTYSLTTSLLPFVFCVLGIVGGYYIFRT